MKVVISVRLRIEDTIRNTGSIWWFACSAKTGWIVGFGNRFKRRNVDSIYSTFKNGGREINY